MRQMTCQKNARALNAFMNTTFWAARAVAFFPHLTASSQSFIQAHACKLLAPAVLCPGHVRLGERLSSRRCAISAGPTRPRSDGSEGKMAAHSQTWDGIPVGDLQCTRKRTRTPQRVSETPEHGASELSMPAVTNLLFPGGTRP